MWNFTRSDELLNIAASLRGGIGEATADLAAGSALQIMLFNCAGDSS
jgi:hypothetical protein